MPDIKFIWRGLKARHRDQILELQLIKQALSGGGIAVDIGANKGSYLYSMAKWCRRSLVFAFEPQIKLAQYLTMVCKRNGFSNVIIENLAISDRAGEFELFVPGSKDSPGASLERIIAKKTVCHVETVRTVTLDSYFFCNLNKKINEKIKVIKIDVEGHEMAVIEGAKKIIEQDKPLLIIECEARHLPLGQSVKTFVERVERMGYAASLVTSRSIELPAFQFDENIHQKKIGERFWDAKNYYNNFIFRPIK